MNHHKLMILTWCVMALTWVLNGYSIWCAVRTRRLLRATQSQLRKTAEVHEKVMNGARRNQ